MGGRHQLRHTNSGPATSDPLFLVVRTRTLDYIRHHGDDSLGGLHLVSALTKLGSEDAMSVITPETLGVAPGLFATDAEESVRNLEAFIRMFFAQQPSGRGPVPHARVQCLRSAWRS